MTSHLSSFTRVAAVGFLLLLPACKTKGSGESEAESTSRSSANAGKKSKPPSSAGRNAASSASSTARPVEKPDATLDAAAFCARAAKLSEANLGKCTVAEQENAVAPALDAVKSIRSITKECEVRVGSAKATFDPKAAARCIEAAEKRGGLMTFYRFSEVPECRGVVVGTTGEGQPVLYAEECAPGLAWVNNRCAKPGTKNARCARGAAGILGDPAQHTQCDAGLACLYTRYPYEGDVGELHCLEPTAIGGACRVRGRDPRLTHLCPDDTSCYQGKCRARAAEGGECMTFEDCGANLQCEIKGGVFGKCVPHDNEKCLANR